MCIVPSSSLSLSLSAAINPATCNASIDQQTIISTAAVVEAIEDEELIVIVPEKKRRRPPFIGIRGQLDWTHSFTALKPSMTYRVQLEFASLTEVGVYNSHQFLS